MEIDYKSAGVDVEAGYKAVALMKKYVKETYDNSILGDIGSSADFTPLTTSPTEMFWWRERTAWAQSLNTLYRRQAPTIRN